MKGDCVLVRMLIGIEIARSDAKGCYRPPLQPACFSRRSISDWWLPRYCKQCCIPNSDGLARAAGFEKVTRPSGGAAQPYALELSLARLCTIIPDLASR